MNNLYVKQGDKVVVLSGKDTDWTPVSVELNPSYITNFFLKLYFAQSGLELRNIRLVLQEDREEEIRAAQAAARATDRGNAE
jgi:beta-glucosidase